MTSTPIDSPSAINQISARQTAFFALENVPFFKWVFRIGLNQFDARRRRTLRTT
jgi:hypothetical protein